jgi:Uma2 family endonuclease
MTTLATPKLMTLEEFLALPEDGIERDLIRGRLREWGKRMTRRNRWHTRVEARLSHLLWVWLERQPEPRGLIHAGEVGCILRRDPDSTVGIDVVYVSAEVAARNPDDTTQIDGVPVLAVEILSPNDTEKETNDKIDLFLEVGVNLVWVVDPRFRTIDIYRPGAEPERFNVNQELSGEPHLPGFRVPVAQVFAR